jgi:hypothetical protein
LVLADNVLVVLSPDYAIAQIGRLSVLRVDVHHEVVVESEGKGDPSIDSQDFLFGFNQKDVSR